MKVVSPVNIFNSVTIIGELSSADSQLPEWDPQKSDYAHEDEIKVLADKKKYKLAAQSVTAGLIPKDNPTIWVAAPLAEYAMFDLNNEYAPEITGSRVFFISDANFLDTLFFQDIDGDTITVELLRSDNTVIDTLAENIYDWEIDSFARYLFPTDPVLKPKIQFDFLELELEAIKITISGTTTKCRYFVCGEKVDIGMTLCDGIGYTQNNFYKTTRDSWGNLVDSGQRLIETVSLPVLDYNKTANINASKTSKLFGTPKLWIADDRDRKSVEFDFINLFAVFVSNNTVPGSTTTQKTLKLEGK